MTDSDIKPATPAASNAIAAALAKATNAGPRERARIASEQTRIARQKTVDFPQYGFSFCVRPMPSGASLDVFAAAQKNGMPDATAYYVSLIQGSTYDPGTDNLSYPPDEKGELTQAYRDIWALGPDIFGPLQSAAQEVNVTTKEADDALGKTSGETDSDDSSSASPATSGARSAS